MSRYHKIKPILHYDLIIKSKLDLNNFSRKRYNFPRNLTAKSADSANFYIDEVERRKCRNVFHKLINMLKCVKSAHLEDSFFFHISNDPAKLYMIKRMRQVRTLSLNDLVSDKRSLTCVSWLKFAKKLKSIVYSTESSYFRLTESIFLKKLNRLSTWFNRVKVRRLEIMDDYHGKKNFLHYKYPKSLECLGLDLKTTSLNKKADKEMMKTKFTHLTNLKKLSLNLQVAEGILTSLLNSIPDLQQLRVLDLDFRRFDDTTASKLAPFFCNGGRLQQLTNLRLDVHVWSKTLEPLLDAFKGCPLMAFSFSGSPNTSNEDDLGYLSSFISGFKDLTSLELNIKNHQNIKLSPGCLLPILREVLSKPVPLTAFSLSWNRFEAQKVFPELITLLTEIARGLKVVKISIGKYEPDDKQFKELLQFFTKLRVIHTLELCQVNISRIKDLEKIANIVCGYKDIRVLTIGKVLRRGAKDILVESVEKILSKRGMERFMCDVGQIFTYPVMSSYRKNLEYIDLQRVCLKNPYLETRLLKYLVKQN